jgi:hypothetical protein
MGRSRATSSSPGPRALTVRESESVAPRVDMLGEYNTLIVPSDEPLMIWLIFGCHNTLTTLAGEIAGEKRGWKCSFMRR